MKNVKWITDIINHNIEVIEHQRQYFYTECITNRIDVWGDLYQTWPDCGAEEGLSEVEVTGNARGGRGEVTLLV